jgi:hypothetical protein
MRRSTGRLIVACAIALFALVTASTSPAPGTTPRGNDVAATSTAARTPVGVLATVPGPDGVRTLATRAVDDLVVIGAPGAAGLLVLGLLAWLLRSPNQGSPGRARRARTRGRAPPALRVV